MTIPRLAFAWVLPFAVAAASSLTAAAAAQPSVSTLTGVSEGQNLRGTVAIQARIQGTARNVAFQLSGPDVKWHVEGSAPYYFLGDQDGVARGWDTRTYADGEYRLTVTPLDASGRGTPRSVTFRLVNRGFHDGFDRADSGDVGATWVAPGWSIQAGQAHTFERGYASLQTAQSFSATRYELDSRAAGFGPTQGPSPGDSVDLTFGHADLARNNYYRVSYQATTNVLAIQRVYELVAGGEFTVQTLAQKPLVLDAERYHRIRVVRDYATGLIQAYVDDAPTPLLQAVDRSYAALGHFGWILQSEAPGNFDVDHVSARWERP
jgi:hypothetical protein